MPKHSRLPAILLGILCLFHLAINTLWLSENKAAPTWDEAGHTRLSVDYTNYFQGTAEKATNPLNISSYYPPLTYFFSAFLMQIGGISEDVATLVVTLYFCGLLVATYLLTDKLFHHKWIALVAASTLSFFPAIYFNSRIYLLEIPLLTTITITWYCILQSKSFQNWLWTVASFLGITAIILTKWTGVIFILIPIISELVTYYRKHHPRHILHTLRFAFIGSFICGVLIFPWYFANWDAILANARIAATGEITDPQNVLSKDSLTYYLTNFIHVQLSFWPTLFFALFSVIFFLSKKTPHRKKLLSFFVFGYITFSLISNKDPRYTLPLLLVPAICFGYLTVKWVERRRLSVLFSTITFGLIVVLFFIYSFPLVPPWKVTVNTQILGWMDIINTGAPLAYPPQAENPINTQTMKTLSAHSNHLPIRVMVGIDQPRYNPATLDLERSLQRSWDVHIQAPYGIVSFQSSEELKTFLDQYQYFIIPTGSVGPDAVRQKVALEQIQNFVLKENPYDYPIIQTFQLPEYSETVYLIKHTQS